MREDDFQVIIDIDSRVTGFERVSYYERKMASMLDH